MLPASSCAMEKGIAVGGSSSPIKTICFVTCNRSDWSKLQPVATKLSDLGEKIPSQGPNVKVEVIALGSHMLQELGGTISEVQQDFPDAYGLFTLVSGDSTHSMADSVGFGITKVSSLLQMISPDILVIHGDRFDAFSVAVAANIMNIPIAHIEGGELSGTVDGTLRHAITKLSDIHFACTEDAARRIRAMGENPLSVFTTGCPSYDKLFATKPSSWEDENMSMLLAPNSFQLKPKGYILALMHAVTNDEHESVVVFECMVKSLFEIKSPTVMFYPNVDPGNKKMIQILHKYQKNNENWQSWLQLVTHVPTSKFTTLMMSAAAMIGNSSAGIRETCVFGTPTLNLGTRQDGRRTPVNVTTMESPTGDRVVSWLKQWSGKRLPPSTLYGYPDSSQRIADLLVASDARCGQLKGFWEPPYSLLPPPLSMTALGPSDRVLSNEKNENLNRFSTTGRKKGIKVLGLITARGGSKGIPGKNIKLLNGKPLIQYTIEAASKSKKLDRVVLSTDSIDIAHVAQRCGCEVPFMRPDELGQDDSAHMDCVIHALDSLKDQDGYDPDYVLLLQPTSPFRTSKDIDNAINLAETSGCDSVVGVCEGSVHLSKTSFVTSDQTLMPYAESTEGSTYIRRQDLAPTFSENGAIYLQRTHSLRFPPVNAPNAGSLCSKFAKALIMPKERSLDIDDMFDFHLAEILCASPFSLT